MRIFLLIIGIFMTLEGIFLILLTRLVKNWSTKLLSIKNYKPWGTVGIILSILLFLASPFSRLSLLIILLGLGALFKGLFFTLTSYDKAKFFVNWWISLSEGNFRILGVVVLILGILIIRSVI